jgi:hypothetical protein
MAAITAAFIARLILKLSAWLLLLPVAYVLASGSSSTSSGSSSHTSSTGTGRRHGSVRGNGEVSRLTCSPQTAH